MIKCKIVVGLLLGMLLCSCMMHTSTTKLIEANVVSIENGPPQGSPFTDSLGNQFAFTYVTSIITNNDTVPIDLDIDFLLQYDYSNGYPKRNYQVILLPKELTPLHQH